MTPEQWAREAWRRATDDDAHEPRALRSHIVDVIRDAMLQIQGVASVHHSRGYVDMLRAIRASIGDQP